MHVLPDVLLAEPDAELRRAIAAALRESGHQVEEVSDGAALLLRVGWRMARIDAPRAALVIVAGACLPVFDGTEVLDILRRFDWNVPCIVIDGTTKAVAQQPGANGVAWRTFDLEHVRTLVQTECARRSRRPEGAAPQARGTI